MSQRHRVDEVYLPPRQERRAHAHGERRRINVRLLEIAELVSAGHDPVDVHEPGIAWKPQHHRDPARAERRAVKVQRKQRHWKTKMWKRRSTVRRERAAAFRLVADL